MARNSVKPSVAFKGSKTKAKVQPTKAAKAKVQAGPPKVTKTK